MTRCLSKLCFLFALFAPLFFAGNARAQNVSITYPTNGQAVRGEITVRYTGIPDGGYAVIKVDGNFLTATSQTSFVLNTFPPTFPGDGTHKISVTGINAGGRAVGTAEVSFEVANNRIDPTAGSTPLTHWTASDRIGAQVQRYRVFAQSDASIEAGGTAGGGAGAGGGGAGGGEGGEEWIPAPLDWQISALMRREVRDVGMFSDDRAEGITAANIRTVVQMASQRQRQSEGGGAGAEGGAGGAGAAPKKVSRRKKKASAPTKAPWMVEWETAPETGQYFVKMIEPSGREINATRKAPTIALADLLPTFPTSPVSPGSTWETRMTFLGELTHREPVNVSVPITFTSYETIQTPGGFSRRAAKLESRFQMPESLAKRIAVNLILQGGSAAGGGTGGPTGAGAGGAEGATAAQTASQLPADELAEYFETINPIRTSVSRVLWFDVEKRRVLRSEDTMRTYFEYEPLEGEGAVGGGGAGAGGGEAAAAEPSKISYTMTVTTWFDDSVPNASDRFTGGEGTAHGTIPGTRDKYNSGNPTVERISKPVQP